MYNIASPHLYVVLQVPRIPTWKGVFNCQQFLRCPDFTARQYRWPDCPQAINNILVEGGVTHVTGGNENVPFTVLATALVGILQNAHQQDLLPEEYFVNVKGYGPDTMTANDLISWVARLADETATEEDTTVNAVEIGVPCGKDNTTAGHSIRKAISTLPFGDGASESTNLVLKQRDYFLSHSSPPSDITEQSIWDRHAGYTILCSPKDAETGGHIDPGCAIAVVATLVGKKLWTLRSAAGEDIGAQEGGSSNENGGRLTVTTGPGEVLILSPGILHSVDTLESAICLGINYWHPCLKNVSTMLSNLGTYFSKRGIKKEIKHWGEVQKGYNVE